MNDVKGNTQFFGMKPTRSLQRYVERQIEKWIERQQTLLFFPKSGSYEVQIERTSEFPYYECALEVRLGGREWRGRDSGRTLHDALNGALRRLQTFNIYPFTPPILRKDDQHIVA